jgi:hypothetical protein
MTAELRAWNEPVRVIWEDHHSKSDESEWGQPTPPDYLKPILVRSAGFIVSENEDMIELARDAYMDEDELVISGPIRILRKCIVSLTYLREPIPS